MPVKKRLKKPPAALPADGRWYQGGLRFKCTGCSNCCTGGPGYVFVRKEEIAGITAFLGREGEGLTRKHLRRVGIRHALTEDKATGDCCFLEHCGEKCKEHQRDAGATTGATNSHFCSIYPVRPLQCRTWPFWKSNLKSPDEWTLASLNCPGMNGGRLHDVGTIEQYRMARRPEELPT